MYYWIDLSTFDYIPHRNPQNRTDNHHPTFFPPLMSDLSLTRVNLASSLFSTVTIYFPRLIIYFIPLVLYYLAQL